MRVSLALSFALSAAVAALPPRGPVGATPDAAPSTPTAGGLRGYQLRLESEAVRILGPEVSGEMKARLGQRGTSLWACVSVREWQRQVLVEAPSLARALEVVARRGEVLWREAGVADALTDPIPQMATVHAMQRGLVRVLVQLGGAKHAAARRADGAACARRPAPPHRCRHESRADAAPPTRPSRGAGARADGAGALPPRNSPPMRPRSTARRCASSRPRWRGPCWRR